MPHFQLRTVDGETLGPVGLVAPISAYPSPGNAESTDLLIPVRAVAVVPRGEDDAGMFESGVLGLTLSDGAFERPVIPDDTADARDVRRRS